MRLIEIFIKTVSHYHVPLYGNIVSRFTIRPGNYLMSRNTPGCSPETRRDAQDFTRSFSM